MTKARISLHQLTDLALDAFWQVVADHHADASSGDLSPGRTMQLHLAAQDAIEEWVENNVPPARKNPR